MILRRIFAAMGAFAFGFAMAPSLRASTLDESAEKYRPLMIADIDQTLAGARKLNERISAQDVAGAQKAWVDARVGWERAEVFTAGFVSELDELIDAWPNAQTGFHAIEAKLFGGNSVDVSQQAKDLNLHLADLDVKVHYTPFNAQGLLNGTARLAYEVGENKSDGGESRFSGTSLDDMRNNVVGIALAYKTVFADALRAQDANLADQIQTMIDEMGKQVAVADLKSLDPDALRTKSEDLVIALQMAAPKIGLHAPTLEDLTQ